MGNARKATCAIPAGTRPTMVEVIVRLVAPMSCLVESGQAAFGREATQADPPRIEGLELGYPANRVESVQTQIAATDTTPKRRFAPIAFILSFLDTTIDDRQRLRRGDLHQVFCKFTMATPHTALQHHACLHDVLEEALILDDLIRFGG